MKKILISFLLFLPLISFSQDRTTAQPCIIFAEVTDSIETAFRTYYGDWVVDGFSIKKRLMKDSIGQHRVITTRLFYVTFTGKKVYLPAKFEEYPEGNKNVDDRIMGY